MSEKIYDISLDTISRLADIVNEKELGEITIIESMKLMNEVQSEFDGTVAEILVKNGEAVEFDQPIMIIK